MILTDVQISNTRRWSLGAVGVVCAVYAAFALAQNRPDPTLWYIPAAAGLVAGVVIFALFFIAGPTAIRMASDEMYRTIRNRAGFHAYWIAVAMYPLFGILSVATDLQWPTIFAAMGTLNAASYLLLLTLYDWRA